MPVFVGDIVELRLDTDETLTGLDVYIKYQKPNGVKGVWAASVCVISADVVTYTTQPFVDLDIAGSWNLQAFSKSGVATRSHGKIVSLEVQEPIRLYITTLAPTTLAPTTPVP